MGLIWSPLIIRFLCKFRVLILLITFFQKLMKRKPPIFISFWVNCWKWLLVRIVTPSLFSIFSKSVLTGIYPNDWKTAYVTPLFKKGIKSNPNNYRPISVIPVISNVYQRFPRRRLWCCIGVRGVWFAILFWLLECACIAPLITCMWFWTIGSQGHPVTSYIFYCCLYLRHTTVEKHDFVLRLLLSTPLTHVPASLSHGHPVWAEVILWYRDGHNGTSACP